MIVASLTTTLSAMPKQFRPEVLYVLFLVWLLCPGPGEFSVDYWLAGKLRS